MKKLIISGVLIVASAGIAFGQKGVDEQTKKIQEDAKKTTSGTSNSSNSPGGRSIDWGGRTRTRERLENPYRLNSRRDALIENVMDVLQEQKIVVDEASSRPKDGIIVTQPFVFAKGAVITKNALTRYAELPFSDTSWTRGRYTLTIEIQSIDGIQNNVSVTAKVEGRSENGIQPEWTTLQSKGIAEDEFLKKLVEAVTGVSFEDPKPADQ